MDSTELARLEAQARGRYERARWGRGAVGFAPVLLLVAAAAGVSHRPATALLFGALLFGAGVALLWYGRTLHRAVLPGVLAGLIPLTAALAANLTHGCTGHACYSYCVPACASGGVVAGLVVSTVARRRGHGWGFWAAGTAVALLTGAMGCACVGYSGVLGLAAGFAAGAAPQAARRLLA